MRSSPANAAADLRGQPAGLSECDIMVAMLDGPQVDDGTAWEVDIFSAGKNIGDADGLSAGGEDNSSQPHDRSSAGIARA